MRREMPKGGRVMKRWAIVTVVGVLAAGAPGASEESARTITATGTAQVKGTPDTAEVTLEVTTHGFSADSAVRDNKRAIEGVLRRLAEHGVSAKEARLSAPQVYPEFDNSF